MISYKNFVFAHNFCSCKNFVLFITWLFGPRGLALGLSPFPHARLTKLNHSQLPVSSERCATLSFEHLDATVGLTGPISVLLCQE